MGFFQGLKNKFETAVVNEPSVFESLKVYCIRVHVYADTSSIVKACVPQIGEDKDRISTRRRIFPVSLLANLIRTHQLPRDNQRDREQQTLLKSISSDRE